MYPYLVMNGNGQEAIQFYEKALKAKIVNVQTFGEMPPNPEMPLPKEAESRILNAHLQIGDIDWMLSDTFPGQEHQSGNHVTIALILDNVEETRELYDALKEKGNIGMPLQETFWSHAYGQVTDQFGVIWQLSADK